MINVKQTFRADESTGRAKFESLAKCRQKIVGRHSEDRVRARDICESQVEQCPRDILGTDQPFRRLETSAVFSIIGLRCPDALQDFRLYRTGEVHDNLATVSPEPECRVVISLYRRRCFVDVTDAENVVDGGAESKAREDILLLGSCHLYELAANIDDHFDLSLRLRKASNRLVPGNVILDDTDCLFRKMNPFEVKVCLQIIDAPQQAIFHILRVEDARFVPRAQSQKSPKATSTPICQLHGHGPGRARGLT